MLQDDTVPSEFRENMRNMLRIMVQQARHVVNGGVAA